MKYICNQSIAIENIVISEHQIKTAILKTNTYLNNISKYFLDIDMDLFGILGQRNISGFIGEVFSRFLSQASPDLQTNPHQDGRPDILNLSTVESKSFFSNSFINDLRKNPIKSRFSPYPYGGIEVKCTIGDSVTKKKREEILLKKYNQKEFSIRRPRIHCFQGITFWGHHQDCSNLLGIYYDYYEKSNYNPQIISIFYTQLENCDWSNLSVGHADSKKTSNTSLNTTGKQAIKNGLIAIIDDSLYIEALEKRGYILKST